MHKDLNEFSKDELGKLFPITLVDPNPLWRVLFQREKKKIMEELGEEIILRIEHIGSTAVPNLKAKPTIDILLEIKKDINESQIINPLKKIGYHLISKPENPPPHIMFAKGYSPHGLTGQTYHIHVRYKGDWDEIYFRNYLRDQPQAREAYEHLKIRLERKYKYDRDAYTDAKSDFIKTALKKAKMK